ncbi:MAG: tail fiber domain-containing protein [Acidobacteriota bacterium]
MELRIAGPGALYIQKEFAAGEPPSFNALDRQLLDGVYSYELRAAGDVVQTGSLWVQDGRFIEPQAQESKPPLRNVTAQTTVVPDDLLVQGQACIGANCGLANLNGSALSIREYGNYQIKFDADNCCVPWEVPWVLQANEPGVSGDFLIRGFGLSNPFRINAYAPDNSFTIFAGGNIGLGTSTPAQKLHVVGSNGATQTLIEETSATTALRTLVQLKNNGDIRLNYNNTATGVQWGANMISGNYKLIKAGAGVTAVDVQGNGNVTIAGILIQNSDRTTKHDIVAVQPDEILGKVLNLPISTWVRNGDEGRHLGPMAQDFAAAFGLGEDDRHIATIDMAGVSLASVQALNSRMKTEIEALRQKNSDLATRVEALEKMVSTLLENAAAQPNP